MIVKKINDLRTNYRKEKKKIEESSRSGAGTNNVYVPTLWYYDLLKFLDDDQGTLRSSRSNIVEDDSSEETIQASMNSDVLPSQDRDDNSPETASTSTQISSRPRPPKRKSNSNPHSLDSPDLSTDVLQVVKEHFKRPLLSEDRFDIFGENVAMKLRDLPIQQRLIDEIL
ncbi:unnamed protein product [Acanthoscelides obtectus]|uniref:MADF domain-containing protein n=1 Tax=Acanthoscelides obtectus TaxID=200917 RepID=A0A9P0JT27_ACAOB|nr:unnamed protein product [Acanthoscelides obtectus]CAK1633920.1 hypothetical protein AOBTE_LOCUS8487 [Acanthoscelides obtectus]